ncbi:hypothetical protein HBA55_28990 [Pseudomaricurvus alkylphenolicus]|uniref:hypothetical protein n=1 Tax=Pseudomaricurvus alkylphenolicus TaxID=1306991 RepID=UPI00142368C2|nr:hypothetical protein [Pseudomaricurvus alkylphenolicus]NIB43680.1 hypothetical protein [Pseudomaricurvus alkylphenolicus]
MPQYEFCVSLKVAHPNLDAERISDRLSMTPDSYCNAGADRVSNAGQPLGGVYENTIWSRDLTVGKLQADAILFEHFIAQKNEEFLHLKEFFHWVRSSGGTVEYFVGWFSTGSVNMNIVLDSDVMSSTSDLGLSIVLCAYPED